MLLVLSALTACSRSRATEPAAAASAGKTNVSAAWVKPLEQCLPGTKFDACTAALDAAKLHYVPLVGARTGTKEIGFDLSGGDFLGLSIHAEQEADWRITQVRIGLSRRPGAERQELIAWFKPLMMSAKLDEASDGNAAAHCGASTSGPAWSTTGGDSEVQLALHRVPWFKPPHGKPMEKVFVNTRGGDDGVSICFIFPNDVKQPVLSPDVMRKFVSSSMFADKTKPR